MGKAQVWRSCNFPQSGSSAASGPEVVRDSTLWSGQLQKQGSLGQSPVPGSFSRYSKWRETRFMTSWPCLHRCGLRASTALPLGRVQE